MKSKSYSGINFIPQMELKQKPTKMLRIFPFVKIYVNKAWIICLELTSFVTGELDNEQTNNPLPQILRLKQQIWIDLNLFH